MTTLDLRSTGGTLQLARNGGTATVRSFMVVGQNGANGTNGTNGARGVDGATGPAGPQGPPGAGASGSYPNLARTPDMLIVGTITRDGNGAATSAPVAWPDGTPGTYTALTVSSAFPGAVDAYQITYGSPVTKTFTQPAVTRDANGAAVTVPAIVVS